ncbi:hypothetical protein OCO53_12510 [Peribacillus frigoritolerans]|nr:hypothetical protein [Peribacillus frigoritolerans]MCU6601293.1 hypothetical protein [Peribacillus frigoritolerans]
MLDNADYPAKIANGTLQQPQIGSFNLLQMKNSNQGGLRSVIRKI